ncbi:hypothetical protein BB559_003060 [Furculomyces boomerangus]|uniref:Cystathionine gamma-synthase n=2 Tax=Harpellales TaxID=61421 RepID=A0A2T9YPA6_9FUNG|nr:hypothetical protein BB559_003060 [Furculomyces boomerangus]PVZ96592.1 hypothetical protein BB558_007491 [Smittium angustum]
MVEIKNPLYDSARMSTQSIHADQHLIVSPEVAPGITLSSTYLYSKNGHTSPNFGNDQLYQYSRYGTPTIARAESVLGTLTNGYATMHSSGLTSLFALLIHYRPTRIAMKNGYFGSTNVVNLYRTLVPNLVVISLSDQFKENDFVWLETPLNPTGEVDDIRYYANKAHAVNAILAVDSTFAPPPLCDPFKQGADVIVHSGTKYFGGHADVLCGVIVTKCREMNEALHKQRNVMGATPGSMEAWLILRSIRTLELRVRQQSKTTHMLVAWLANAAKGCNLIETDGIPVGAIKSVKHASIQTFSPSFDVCAQHPNGFGPVFSVVFKTQEQALFVARHLRLTTFATSLGGVMSLADWRHGDDPTQDPGLLRISVGLEDIEDLKNDWRSTIQASQIALESSKL